MFFTLIGRESTKSVVNKAQRLSIPACAREKAAQRQGPLKVQSFHLVEPQKGFEFDVRPAENMGKTAQSHKGTLRLLDLAEQPSPFDGAPFQGCPALRSAALPRRKTPPFPTVRNEQTSVSFLLVFLFYVLFFGLLLSRSRLFLDREAYSIFRNILAF